MITYLLIGVIIQGVGVIGALMRVSYRSGQALQKLDEHERRLNVLEVKVNGQRG